MGTNADTPRMFKLRSSSGSRPLVALPSWFKADRVFAIEGQWYFGSARGLHIGPYADRYKAQAKGQAIAKRFGALKTNRDRLNFLRNVLDDESLDSAREMIGETTEAEKKTSLKATEDVRSGEQPKKWYRSGRLFQVEGMWFFGTREGIDVGPFDSEIEAKKHEKRLVGLLIQTDTKQAAHKVIHEYNARPGRTYRSTARTQFTGKTRIE